jgi:uncharacterized protein (DUF736 family)
MGLKGELRKKADGFEGYIASESMDHDLVVTRNSSNERSEGSPDYIIFTKSPKGRLIEIGGVWKRICAADNDYLSLTLTIDGREYRANSVPKKDSTGVLALREWAI